METLFITVAVACAVIGFFALSSATQGVGLICIGCFLAIFARVVQADRQHAAALERMGKL